MARRALGALQRTGTAAALIDAGRKLFARRGFDGTSVRAITREAGANLGAVTYHFGSKRGLYGAVLEHELRPLALRASNAARGLGSATERIDAVVEAYFEHLGEHPDLPALLLQEVAAGKKPPAEVVDIIRKVAGALGGLVVEGQTRGEFRRGHPLLMAVSTVSQPVFLTLIAPLLREVAGIDPRDPETRPIVLGHAAAFVRSGLTGEEVEP